MHSLLLAGHMYLLHMPSPNSIFSHGKGDFACEASPFPLLFRQRLNSNHFIDQQNQPDEKRITDSNFKIIGKKTGKYHLECESSRYSSRVMIRLFKYDAQIALDEAELGRESIHVAFPNTMVLYLRNLGNPPDEMTVQIETPGGAVSYAVPVMKMSSYSLEDIFEKKLYLLIPFYIFNFEKKFLEYE